MQQVSSPCSGKRRHFQFARSWIALTVFSIVLPWASPPNAHATENPQLSAEVQARLNRATVRIDSHYRPINAPDASPRNEPLFGSGFVVASEGLILTTADCVATVLEYDERADHRAGLTTRPEDREVFILDRVIVKARVGKIAEERLGEEVSFRAQVLCTLPKPINLALLRINSDKPLESLSFISPEHFVGLATDDPVWSGGYKSETGVSGWLARSKEDGWGQAIRAAKRSMGWSIHQGKIVALLKSDKLEHDIIEHGCNFSLGACGGPLVDSKGQVVGINVSRRNGRGVAIPASVALEQFSETLESRRGASEGGQRQPRILRVDPKSDDAYESIHAAAKAAKPGDTITIAPGEYRCESDDENFDGFFWVPRGVFVHGAGIEKTRIVVDWGARIPRGFAELSNLTLVLDADRDSWTLAIGCMNDALFMGNAYDTSKTSEVFLHDLKVIKRHSAGRVVAAGHANIVNCRFESPKTATGNSPGLHVRQNPRIERSTLPPTLLLAVSAANPTLQGCVFNGPTSGKSGSAQLYVNVATPNVIGCLFRGLPESHPSYFDGDKFFGNPYHKSVRVVDGGGLFRSNHFEFSNRLTSVFTVSGGQKELRIQGNHFDCNQGRREPLVYAYDPSKPNPGDRPSYQHGTGIAVYISKRKHLSINLTGNLFDACDTKRDGQQRQWKLQDTNTFRQVLDGRKSVFRVKPTPDQLVKEIESLTEFVAEPLKEPPQMPRSVAKMLGLDDED